MNRTGCDVFVEYRIDFLLSLHRIEPFEHGSNSRNEVFAIATFHRYLTLG